MTKKRLYKKHDKKSWHKLTVGWANKPIAQTPTAEAKCKFKVVITRGLYLLVDTMLVMSILLFADLSYDSRYVWAIIVVVRKRLSIIQEVFNTN